MLFFLGEIFYLENLENFLFVGNKIKELLEKIKWFKCLRELFLGCNVIDIIFYLIVEMECLWVLYLDNNELNMIFYLVLSLVEL